jgi:hypothetical protein
MAERVEIAGSERGRSAAAAGFTAGDADRETGSSVLVDRNQQTIGGTSAVALPWAGFDRVA